MPPVQYRFGNDPRDFQSRLDEFAPARNLPAAPRNTGRLGAPLPTTLRGPRAVMPQTTYAGGVPARTPGTGNMMTSGLIGTQNIEQNLAPSTEPPPPPPPLPGAYRSMADIQNSPLPFDQLAREAPQGTEFDRQAALAEFNTRYSQWRPSQKFTDLQSYDTAFKRFVGTIPGAQYIMPDIVKGVYEAHMPDSVKAEYSIRKNDTAQSLEAQKIEAAMKATGREGRFVKGIGFVDKVLTPAEQETKAVKLTERIQAAQAAKQSFIVGEDGKIIQVPPPNPKDEALATQQRMAQEAEVWHEQNVKPNMPPRMRPPMSAEEKQLMNTYEAKEWARRQRPDASQWIITNTSQDESKPIFKMVRIGEINKNIPPETVTNPDTLKSEKVFAKYGPEDAFQPDWLPSKGIPNLPLTVTPNAQPAATAAPQSPTGTGGGASFRPMIVTSTITGKRVRIMVNPQTREVAPGETPLE